MSAVRGGMRRVAAAEEPQNIVRLHHPLFHFRRSMASPAGVGSRPGALKPPTGTADSGAGGAGLTGLTAITPAYAATFFDVRQAVKAFRPRSIPSLDEDWPKGPLGPAQFSSDS